MVLLAALMLAPLVAGFFGKGSFEAVYGQAPGEGAEEASQKRTLLFEALGRSGWVGLGATFVALVLGLPAAWALSRRRTFGRLALCALPLALAPSAAVSGWLYWCAPATVQSSFAVQLPDASGPGPLFSISGAALVLGLGLWPIVAFEAWPAFARARGEPYAAAILAGSPVRAFFKIVLPLSSGELAAGALLVFLLASNDFTVSSLLLVRTLPIEMYDQLALGQYGSAAWTAFPLAALTVALALVLMRVQRVATLDGQPTATPVTSGRVNFACDLVLWLGIALGFLVPLVGCARGAFKGGQPLGVAFGAGWPAFLVTLRLAGAAALFTILLAALRIVFWPQAGSGALNLAALLLIAVPGTFLAAGVLAGQAQLGRFCDVFGSSGADFYRGIPESLYLCAGFVLRFLYLPLRLAEEGLRRVDPALLETAELAGHSRISRGLGVALPLSVRHLAAAGALVFVLVMGELPLADRLAPPKAVPLSVWLFQQQHLGYTEAVFALSLLAGGAALVAVGVPAVFLRGWRLRSVGSP